MAAKGISMRKFKIVLRLHFEERLSIREIAKRVGLAVGTTQKYVSLARNKGLTWPLSGQLEDEEALKFFLRTLPTTRKQHSSERPQADYANVHKELKIKGVTLELLWREQVDQEQNPFSYSRFCHHYRIWRDNQKRSMRQTHKAGDKVFLDYSGKTMSIIDPDTGQIREAQIFVGVLGASNYTYAEATWTQQLPDWIHAQVRMFHFFGGVPALIVPDNLKSAINKACRYEPDINPTYAAFVEHYGTSVLPARPIKPQDKAKVESGVQVVQRWILARLRHRTFVGLKELNAAIHELLVELNQRPFKKLSGSRESLFLEIEKEALRPLPASPYEYKQYKKAQVHVDYHIELNGHYYSVPHQHCGKTVEVWFGHYTVECYVLGQCVASHMVSNKRGAHTTIPEHMPTAHRKHLQWSMERFQHWAQTIGPFTLLLVNHLLTSKGHPEQAYRSCLGLLNLAKQYGEARLEKACEYGWDKGVRSRKSILSILQTNLDQQTSKVQANDQYQSSLGLHENVRGPHYYH
jgi:transposase